MPPVTANGNELWQLFIQGTIEEQICENVLWFRSAAADTDVVLHLAQAVLECFATNLLPVLAGTYRFERILARRVLPTIGPDIEVTLDAGDNVQGQAEGDAEPSFVSSLISLHSSRGGRVGRGRMFIPGVPEGSTTASSINTASPLWAGLLAFAACMIGKFPKKDVPANGDWEWGVFSRKLGGQKSPYNMVGFADIVTAVPKTLLATTRSRKIGHGR